jgi:hypothetical protein
MAAKMRTTVKLILVATAPLARIGLAVLEGKYEALGLKVLTVNRHELTMKFVVCWYLKVIEGGV